MPSPDQGADDEDWGDDAQDPRLAEVRNLAKNPSPQSVKRLVEIAKGDDLAAAEACEVVLNWGAGPVEDAPGY